MSVKKASLLLALVLLCGALSGCRVRTTATDQTGPADQRETAEERLVSLDGPAPEDGAEEKEDTAEQEKSDDPSGRTKENPEASRKEYDEQAPAEIIPGTERRISGEGEGDGAFAPGEEQDPALAKLKDGAEEPATRTVAADRAEEKGVSEDAEEADSAMTYFTVLLRDRMGGLFECQRLNLYWETREDHVTIHKTSPEHALILDAGAYDVSSRLLEENLRVDDGWIGRKNPGVVVKVTERSVLGSGVSSASEARKVYGSLLARDGWSGMDAVRSGRVVLLSEELLEAPWLRTVAMLIIAKTAHPDLMKDVEIEKALAMLSEEATGSVPAGIYYYNGQGGL